MSDNMFSLSCCLNQNIGQLEGRITTTLNRIFLMKQQVIDPTGDQSHLKVLSDLYFRSCNLSNCTSQQSFSGSISLELHLFVSYYDKQI